MKIKTGKNVEDILYEEGLLTSDQLSAVKFERVNTGKSGEEIIKERKYVPLKKLVEAQGKLLDIPFVELGDAAISSKVLDYVPEQVARKHKLIPFREEGGILHLAMGDPLDLQIIEFIERSTNLKVKSYIAEESDVLRAIADQYGKTIGAEVSAALEEAGVTTTKIEERIKDIEKAEETIRHAPVARIVNTILEYAVKSRASDVHIEPEEERTRVRYRIDGILQERLTLPKKVHDSVIARVKILSNLKIDERRLPQDGRFKIQVGEREIDLRISTLRTTFGEKVAIRLLEERGRVLSFKDLGLRGTALKRFEEALLKPHGIILVTGPTGSGKTVTLASALTKLSTIRVNIVTLEDPVEIQVSGVNQVQIHPGAGLTFASGLRSILRQDPDIMMVGEIRDTDTAQLAVHAALTGHLVLSTLHTNSAAGALPRLLDMGTEGFLLASTVNLVLAQRLVRTICSECKEKYEAPKEVLKDIKNVLGDLFKEQEKGKKVYLYRGKGCEKCGKQGYLGRTGIFEVMRMSDPISRLVLEEKPASEVEKVAISEGMITLKQDGLLKALEGITTIEEVVRVAED